MKGKSGCKWCSGLRTAPLLTLMVSLTVSAIGQEGAGKRSTAAAAQTTGATSSEAAGNRGSSPVRSEGPAALPPSFLLRNTKEGAVEVVINGGVIATFPPGYFVVGMPNAEAVQRENLRKEAEQEEEQAASEQLKKEEEAKAKEAEEAAKKKKLAEEEKQKEAEERAALAENAVTIFNGMTGDYVKAVPLDVVVEKMSAQEKQLEGAAAEKKAQQRAAIEEKAVTIFDGMTGLYVQAVPVETLTNPGDSEER